MDGYLYLVDYLTRIQYTRAGLRFMDLEISSGVRCMIFDFLSNQSIIETLIHSIGGRFLFTERQN